MSGIVAVHYTDGSAAEPTVREVTAALAHRGPDGSGVWCGDGVGLGHQHHCTLPESVGHSFPRSVAGVTVTADLRLDNRAALCSTLEVADDVPDADLVAHAYRRWGTAYPSRLVGAFAAVVWDPERRRLVCARDHMGVKPLYYARGAHGVAVASEPGALLRVAGVGRTPDDTRVGDYLAGRFQDRTSTFYGDVSRLPPAHSMVVTEGEVTLERYWDLTDVDPLPTAHQTAYDDRFRDLFEQAVTDRLRSDGRVGSLLSGGLDSSSIVSVAAADWARRGHDPLRTFSAVFDTVTACDERPYIDAVVDSAPVKPTYIDGDGFGPLVGLDRHLGARSQPYYPSLCMLVWGLFAAAERSGTAVVLQGYGGDQTMGSDVRGYLRGLLGRGQLRPFVTEFRGYLDNYPWLDTRSALWGDVLAPLAPQPLRRLRHRLRDQETYLEGLPTPVDSQFARESGLLERVAADRRRGKPVTQRAVRQRALTASEPAFNLELNDVIGAVHGVEPRFPYFDKRLVEFALALPPGTTVSDGLDRTIVRRALGDVLPDAVRTRTDKAEFSPNVVHGLNTYDAELVRETLGGGPLAADRYLDAGAVRAMVEQPPERRTVAEARVLATATTLERWFRGFTSVGKPSG
jgi:asparagine synthase (glutamine-hydrolysing)